MSVKVVWEEDNVDKVIQSVSGNNLNDIMMAGAKVIQSKARENARKNFKGSGKLEDSIQITNDGDSLSVGSDLPYAAIQEFGGIVKSKNGEWLTFQVNGKWVKTSVSHIPARPYLRPAVDNNTDEINEAMASVVSSKVEGSSV